MSFSGNSAEATELTISIIGKVQFESPRTSSPRRDNRGGNGILFIWVCCQPVLVLLPAVGVGVLPASVNQCKRDVRWLQQRKSEQYSRDRLMADLMDNGNTWYDTNRTLPVNWKPKGVMVAHLHEHRGAVNRYYLYFSCCLRTSSQHL